MHERAEYPEQINRTMYSPHKPLVGTLVDIEMPKVYFHMTLIEDTLSSQHLFL